MIKISEKQAFNMLGLRMTVGTLAKCRMDGELEKAVVEEWRKAGYVENTTIEKAEDVFKRGIDSQVYQSEFEGPMNKKKKTFYVERSLFVKLKELYEKALKEGK